MATLVVIDDEAVLARQVERALVAAGHEVSVAHSCAEGIELVRRTEPDLALVDLRLGDGSGLDVLAAIRGFDENVPVVLMTAYGTVRDAVAAMQKGASDYLQKPLDLAELRLLVERSLAREKSQRELAYHRDRGRLASAGVIGANAAIHRLFEQIDRLASAGLAPGRRPALLLTGESGTGKGLIARAVHERLGGGPFIELNCTAMPSTLIEAELFGHERGSFTDAKSARAGLFETAAGGTLFLDEIGHASLDLQAKLLKVIEDKRARRVGASRDREVDVHVIAATNRDLEEAVAAREFREDLLHRLRVLAFEVPPLRERTADLEVLARHFCAEIGRTYGRQIALGDEGLAALARYPWPGNVRELRNVIERAILLEPGERLGAEAFAGLLARPVGGAADAFRLPKGGVNLAAIERDLIQQALSRMGGNRTRAAALLGLTRDTLRYRLEKFGLE